MSDTIACQMPDVFRAIAPIAGMLFLGTRSCRNRPIAALFIHGTADTVNPISGNVTVRDYLLGTNHCATTMEPVDHPRAWPTMVATPELLPRRSRSTRDADHLPEVEAPFGRRQHVAGHCAEGDRQRAIGQGGDPAAMGGVARLHEARWPRDGPL
jgi:poly(3-hydroxybutyrate) depolymerase